MSKPMNQPGKFVQILLSDSAAIPTLIALDENGQIWERLLRYTKDEPPRPWYEWVEIPRLTTETGSAESVLARA